MMLLVMAPFVACGGDDDSADADAVAPDAHVTPDGGAADGTADGGPPDGTAPDGGVDCPEGLICVSTFPYHDDNDTSTSTSRQYDGYACSPSIDESGPEVIYRLELAEAGFLSAALPDDVPGVDIDLQLLGSQIWRQR